MYREYAISDAQLRRGNGGSLSTDQVGQYDEQGYLVLPGLLSEQDLAPARGAMMEKVDQVAHALFEAGLIGDLLADEPFETRLATLFESLSGEDFVAFTGQSWRDRLPGYFQLLSNTKVLDVVESLIGPEIFANPVYNVRPKVPRVAAGEVPWHQDKSYWPGAMSNPVITVWIALVDATLENGCLRIIPRTQSEAVGGFHFETYSGTAYRELDDEQVGPLKGRARTLPVDVGLGHHFQRPVHSFVRPERIGAHPLERRPPLPTGGPGPDAAVRARLPGPEPGTSARWPAWTTGWTDGSSTNGRGTVMARTAVRP